MLNDRLSELRTERKLRQEDLARKIGIARTTYAMYEQGKRNPDYDTLQKLADFFGVTRGYLLGDTDNPNEEIDAELKNLLEDPDFMVAYKEYPGSPEEAKEDLIGFLKLIKERDERKKKK
ncbi:helix-turn-helix domain-containing protein [Sporolactobacillus sp. STSJ-5]|nr:helix-turn-helix transcriptional regulator [Sporolactobacillus sp. STSJ-5]MCQ2010584.1 helix-turn-helix domain-containing protein [Sporolactobacillus sp. STSJ-5]